MNKRAQYIFFSVFFSIFGLVNYYIFVRGYQGLEALPGAKTLYTIIFLIVAPSFIIGKFVERKRVSIFTDVMIWIGSFWFAFILCFFLTIVLLDLLRLVNYAFNIVTFTPEQYPMIKLWVLIGVTSVVFLSVLYGYINAKTIRVKTFDLAINKNNPLHKELNIVMASDIHLGTIIGRKPTRKIVELINSLKPDIILLPGDIIDSEVEPVVKQDLGEVLKELRATYGVFGVTGNHEYIGGVEEAVKYIRAHNVDLLRDEVREVAGLTIIGREDLSYKSKNGDRRKSLDVLAANIDHTKAVIVMDHQPFHLEEAEALGADLQVSGHTHHGQMWPLSFITKRMYEISWGYLKKGNTHIYVSSGAGSWGPPSKNRQPRRDRPVPVEVWVRVALSR